MPIDYTDPNVIKELRKQAQSHEEKLKFYAIQLYGHIRQRSLDEEAIHAWIWEIIDELGIHSMSDEERQEIVDRHFADLILAIGDEIKSKGPSG